MKPYVNEFQWLNNLKHSVGIQCISPNEKNFLLFENEVITVENLDTKGKHTEVKITLQMIIKREIQFW